MAYFMWYDAVLKLVAAFGMTPDELNDELVSDTLDSVSSPSTPGYSPFRGVVALRSADGSLRRLTAEELDHWKSVNTALYWHVLPSLNLDTAQKLSDVRKVNSFFSGRLADGRALLRWARSFVDASAPELQKRLQRALAERRLSAAGATRASLHSHAETLKQIWELIGSNNPDDPMSLRDYWRELVASLPTEPARTPLVDVRTWLANRVADLGEGSAKALLTFDDGMSSVMSYAQLVGLPAGAAAPTPTLLFTSDTGELCCQLAAPASDGQLLPDHGC